MEIKKGSGRGDHQLIILKKLTLPPTPKINKHTMDSPADTLMNISDFLFFTGEIHMQWLPPIGHQTGGTMEYRRFYAELYQPVELVNIRQVRERLAQPSNIDGVPDPNILLLCYMKLPLAFYVLSEWKKADFIHLQGAQFNDLNETSKKTYIKRVLDRLMELEAEERSFGGLALGAKTLYWTKLSNLINVAQHAIVYWNDISFVNELAGLMNDCLKVYQDPAEDINTLLFMVQKCQRNVKLNNKYSAVLDRRLVTGQSGSQGSQASIPTAQRIGELRDRITESGSQGSAILNALKKQRTLSLSNQDYPGQQIYRPTQSIQWTPTPASNTGGTQTVKPNQSQSLSGYSLGSIPSFNNFPPRQVARRDLPGIESMSAFKSEILIKNSLRVEGWEKLNVDKEAESWARVIDKSDKAMVAPIPIPMTETNSALNFLYGSYSLADQLTIELKVKFCLSLVVACKSYHYRTKPTLLLNLPLIIDELERQGWHTNSIRDICWARMTGKTKTKGREYINKHIRTPPPTHPHPIR